MTSKKDKLAQSSTRLKAGFVKLEGEAKPQTDHPANLNNYRDRGYYEVAIEDLQPDPNHRTAGDIRFLHRLFLNRNFYGNDGACVSEQQSHINGLLRQLPCCGIRRVASSYIACTWLRTAGAAVVHGFYENLPLPDAFPGVRLRHHVRLHSSGAGSGNISQGQLPVHAELILFFSLKKTSLGIVSAGICI